jgi:hypothetical protein
MERTRADEYRGKSERQVVQPLKRQFQQSPFTLNSTLQLPLLQAPISIVQAPRRAPMTDTQTLPLRTS